MAWQLPQPTLAMTRSPATASAPAAAAAGCCCRSTQAVYSAGGTTTKRKRILPCWTPQNSEHSPRYSPVLRGTKWMWFTCPGIMSILPPICGTQNEWMTSADSMSMEVMRSTGA